MRFPFLKQSKPEKKSMAFLVNGTSMGGLFSSGSFNVLAAEGYAANAVAFAAINKIANAIASVEVQLVRKGRGGKRELILEHSMLDLLNRPNAAQSGDEFFRHLTANYLLSGNSFIYGVGLDGRTKKPPLELQILSPGKVRVKAGAGIFPAAYEYRAGGNDAVAYAVDQITGKSPVMHLKTYNPLDPWNGLSPLMAAAYGVDIYTGSQRWNKKLLDNDARPSGALTVKDADGKPGNLSESAFKRLQEMIEHQFSGQGNAGKPLLLEGGLEWQEMSMSARDMDFAESKNAAARDIGLAFGVPPQLLGIKGDQTFANYEQATLSFWTETVLPLLKLILESFNRWLVPYYGADLELWFNEDEIEALEPLRKTKADRINAAAYMTVNEKRRAMGLEDVEGGEAIFVPSGNIPLELAGSMMALPEPGSPATAKV